MRTIRNVQVRTARPHQCPGCLRGFEQGAQMEAVTMVEDTPRIIITIHLCAVCRRWLACQRILEELDLNYGDAWTEGGSRGNLRLEPDWAAFREQIEGGALMAILTEYYTVKVRRDSCGACRAGAYKNAKGGA